MSAAAHSLTAVSSSAKQMFSLLRCIAFSSRALVQILPQGIRFTAEEARVIQGIVFLEKSMFTTYRYEGRGARSPSNADDSDDAVEVAPIFQIFLPALLETLQIFGLNDSARDRSLRESTVDGYGGASAAFSHSFLGMNNICRFTYGGLGEPLCITMEEGAATTTCELATYEPDDDAADGEDTVPFDRDSLTVKIIMHSAHLFDAIQELSSTAPDGLTVAVSPAAPFFILSALGPLGSASVEFTKDPKLLETFQISGRGATNTYKFSLIKSAARAMNMAAKVSLRIDSQGVLSLQFMIANDDNQSVSFVDFRFVPYLNDELGDGRENSVGSERQGE